MFVKSWILCKDVGGGKDLVMERVDGDLRTTRSHRVIHVLLFALPPSLFKLSHGRGSECSVSNSTSMTMI